MTFPERVPRRAVAVNPSSMQASLHSADRPREVRANLQFRRGSQSAGWSVARKKGIINHNRAQAGKEGRKEEGEKKALYSISC